VAVNKYIYIVILIIPSHVPNKYAVCKRKNPFRNKRVPYRYCGGQHLVINIYFMSYVCLANYGASEAVYPCVVVEKIHESF
jgi:hypothetical protein